MRNKTIWGLGVLVILLVGATVFVSVRNRAEIQEREAALKAAQEELASNDIQQWSSPQQSSVADKPPPPGETPDTGYWEGNTWHVNPAPKPKKRGFWSADPDKLAHRMTFGRDIEYLERFQLAQRIIREYPYSEAAIEARYKLMDHNYTVESLKDMLKYHPNSPRVLTDLAGLLEIDSPEESIVFGQKSLRIDPSNAKTRLALGAAYQRLGDYKTALFHLKAGQKLSNPDEIAYAEVQMGEYSFPANDHGWLTYEISLIEAGTPRYGPDPQPRVSSFSEAPMFPTDDVSPPSSNPVFAPLAVPSDLSGSRSVDDRGVASSVPLSWRDDPAFHSRESMERARHRREEFEGFRQWLAEIERAESHADLEDFLMREMAKQLQGGTSEFTPARLIRAFETLQQYSENEAGMAALEKRDAALARKMSRENRPQQTPDKKNKE